ncbi:MAG TPA: hypothetical protein VHX66_10465 [Solirubrobacteraceae bacterium]|jgi:hypothetical protein|nr:hypothetical protein [Solirubrobacteraceae bacterium]
MSRLESFARRPRGRGLRRRALGLAAAIGVAAAVAAPSTAYADGDPASDVLVTANQFIPWDAGLSASQQSQLAALLALARRDGATVRLTIIASPLDLGSVTQLWRRPRAYAAYLGEELSLVYHGPLVVVMPDGIGVYHAAAALNRTEASIAASAPPGARAGALFTAAASAVRRIAAAAGHALGSVRGASAATQPSGPGIASWLALVLGAALIVGAWIASLRLRPVSLRIRA